MTSRTSTALIVVDVCGLATAASPENLSRVHHDGRQSGRENPNECGAGNGANEQDPTRRRGSQGPRPGGSCHRTRCHDTDHRALGATPASAEMNGG